MALVVQGGLVALTVFLTHRAVTPVVETPRPVIIFPRTRPVGTPASRTAPAAAHPAAARPRRPNTVVQPRTIEPISERPAQVEPVVGEAVGDSSEVGDSLTTVTDGPIGDPNGTVTGTGEGPEGLECNPACAFGDGMTRPQVAPQVFANVYSRAAVEAQVEGTMVVRCRVQVDGALSNCRVVKGLPHLDEAVLEKLATVRATPATINGRAIPVDYVFNFQFKMPR